MNGYIVRCLYGCVAKARRMSLKLPSRQAKQPRITAPGFSPPGSPPEKNPEQKQKAKVMKWNWGTGIAVFYSVFVLVLVFVVYRSTQYDHSLVSDHYYADDLAYQQHYNKLVNAQQLEEDLKISSKAGEAVVVLQFPAEFTEVGGEIYFFCPSDQQSDFRLPVQADATHIQRISTQGLRSGRWKVKVNWKAAGKEFYKEETINI